MDIWSKSGYDMYCRLLDEVVKEIKGEEQIEEVDVQIDLGVSSYIPDEFISDSSQKIEVYQDIALCKNDEDIQNEKASYYIVNYETEEVYITKGYVNEENSSTIYKLE